MKIGLIDVDGHNFPNIPLMKLSAYHKKRGDSVEWYEPMFSGRMDRVYMSKVFSYTPDYEYCINADEIIKGGSGYAIEMQGGKEIYIPERDPVLPDEIEHIFPDYSIYGDLTQNTAFGFLTRGCPRACGFCHVAKKEGRCSVKVADLSEFWNGQKKIVLCDPNILASPDHLELLEQLAASGAKVEFNQGLDVRLINDRNLEVLKRIRLEKIHLAFDRYQDKEIIKPKLQEFAEKTGFDRHKGGVTVFILCNFDTTIEEDIERIQFCRKLNFSPYPMIYNKSTAGAIYKRLQRWCNNRIFWKLEDFWQYTRTTRSAAVSNDFITRWNNLPPEE